MSEEEREREREREREGGREGESERVCGEGWGTEAPNHITLELPRSELTAI